MAKEQQMEQKVYEVTGMTCGHCVAAVTAEVSRVSGVQQVDVALPGTLTVNGEGFTDDDVRAAVDEAGYAVAAG
jgi:copper chaperone